MTLSAVDLDQLSARLLAGLDHELPAAIDLRHRLHSDPRVSGNEDHTADAVVEALPDGAVVVLAGTGRWISFGGVGPPVGLRAELDALPILERTGVEWSATGAIMHACGHDLHLAALVAVCRAAAQVTVPTPIVAILQPREEVAPAGGADVAASGLLDGLDAVIAAHLQPRLPYGVFGVTPGATNAGTDVVDIVVEGIGGHGGYPHTTRDPVLALCQVVVSLQQLASRRVDPTVGTVLTIGQVHAGTASNVVPDRVRAQGSFRVIRDSDRRDLLAAMDEIFRSFGADDFSHYCHRTRGLMMFVGTADENAPGGPGLHSDRFLPDDALIEDVGRALIAGYLGAITARAPRVESQGP